MFNQREEDNNILFSAGNKIIFIYIMYTNYYTSIVIITLKHIGYSKLVVKGEADHTAVTQRVVCP